MDRPFSMMCCFHYGLSSQAAKQPGSLVPTLAQPRKQENCVMELLWYAYSRRSLNSVAEEEVRTKCNGTLLFFMHDAKKCHWPRFMTAKQNEKPLERTSFKVGQVESEEKVSCLLLFLSRSRSIFPFFLLSKRRRQQPTNERLETGFRWACQQGKTANEKREKRDGC